MGTVCRNIEVLVLIAELTPEIWESGVSFVHGFTREYKSELFQSDVMYGIIKRELSLLFAVLLL